MNRSEAARERRRRILAELRAHLAAAAAPEELQRGLKQLAEEEQPGGARLVFDEYEEPSVAGDAMLVEVPELRLGEGLRENSLVEGENAAVLGQLARTHGGRVDAIYIDPPYNTGMHGLGYADDFHAGEPCRHSRWLSFMDRRLRLALPLLSARGVMFLHLDEHEFAYGLLLCAGLFGDSSVEALVWPKTDPVFDQNRVERTFRNVKPVHEYVIIAYRNRAGTTLGEIGPPGAKKSLESILRGLGTTSSAKDELGEILGDRLRFQTPKPLRLVKELVRAASGPESVIMDFFAGSGTTGHAVMDLNREDGGARRFVLVTSNEGGICRDIAYARLRHVMATVGYAEGLRYFRLDGCQSGRSNRL